MDILRGFIDHEYDIVIASIALISSGIKSSKYNPIWRPDILAIFDRSASAVAKPALRGYRQRSVLNSRNANGSA